MLICAEIKSSFSWFWIYFCTARLFPPTVVTKLYGHYRQGEQKAENKRMSSDNPYALSLCIGIIELIAQNRCNIDFIDNIYHALFARMFRMPAYDYTV